jgi:hypothetical protein
MADNRLPAWGKIPSLDKLKLTDNTEYPLPGTIVLCLMCGDPFLMRQYSGYPDQVCPSCYDTYKDCCSIICRKCGVVVAKVQPKVMESGFYVRPRSVLHIDLCNVCRGPVDAGHKIGEVDHISCILEMQEYERQIGGTKKIIVTMGSK